ncbi:MAG TPA: hypothetical protein VFS00_02620, partial [Polyangiaceae bacterium]|nr:hypothetical protein [Polyangiaceae bacterium]
MTLAAFALGAATAPAAFAPGSATAPAAFALRSGGGRVRCARPWLGLGPVAIALRSGPWPWGWGPLTRSHPGRARLGVELHVEHRAGAGRDEPLAWAAGRYVGPGFVLEGERERGYRALAAGPEALGGAIAALLIDLGRRASLVTLHAASLAFRGRAFCLAGPSGAGKSTWARRHERRALGSNA